MNYEFSKAILFLLKKTRQEKKTLIELLDITHPTFTAKMNNESFTAIELGTLAAFFKVPVSFFYSDSKDYENFRVEYPTAFPVSTVLEPQTPVTEKESFYEEQLRQKDIQINFLQKLLDAQLGKTSVSVRPQDRKIKTTGMISNQVSAIV